MECGHEKGYNDFISTNHPSVCGTDALQFFSAYVYDVHPCVVRVEAIATTKSTEHATCAAVGSDWIGSRQ